jgi:hypothetical protein
MNTELVPLKPKQNAVSNLPKFTTELPFFYLTKQKELLTQPIDFKGQDSAGNPIGWKVTPSTLGAPGIDAHEVWVKLIKPAIDEARQQNGGELLSIVPLGSVRECLRVLGWSAGGFQARDFFKCIRQMVAALCDADFWLPTTETDEVGKPLLRRIKGSFSRMTLYAVGSAHVTEEELQSGKFSFDFDLEDTVYIQLHPIEVEIQRHQLQRPVDNEYLFSVSPAARRWYELVAPKIFGVTHNRGSEHCDIRYSWYIERHHTLTRQTERWQVAQQMNKLIKDHKAFGYVSRVEYLEVKEPGKDVDFIIRYYPGSGARESTKRIRNRIGKKNWKQLELPLPATTEARQLPAAIAAASDNLTDEQESILKKLTGFGVTETEARQLVTTRFDACRLKVPAVLYLPETQGKMNRAGNIRAFIERDDWQLPQSYLEAKAKAEEVARAETRRRAVEGCSLCDSIGFRFVRNEKNPQGAMKRCSHDAEIEKGFPDAL